MKKQTKIAAGLASIFFLALLFPHKQVYSADSLKIDLDYAVFKYLPDINKSYLEIYYTLEQKELEYIQQPKGFGAVVSLELDLKDQEGGTVKEKSWQIGNRVEDTAKVLSSDAQLIDALGDTLSAGTYSLELKATDVNSKLVGTKKTQLLIPDFKGDSLQLSDIQLALDSKEDTTEVKFNKSGMKVLPNPRREYLSKSGLLYLYAEVYNLKFDPESKKKGYSLNFSILDSTGSNPKDYGSMVHPKPGNTSVVISALNVSSLQPGSHLLQVSVKDLASGEEIKKTKSFQVLASPVLEVKEEPKTEEEAKNLRKMLTYIATKDELRMYDQLNLSGKRQFMTEFWKKKDTDPSTPENEFKIEFNRRWEEAQRRYSTTQGGKDPWKQDGWKTDMGRVYIVYGEPDNIERFPLSMSEKAWEKWYYDNIQGGVYFIFVDEQGYGVYRLMHSTAKGEVYDPSWEDRLNTQSSQY
ncbi:MAG TPA: GWxTD domain-containing protein [Terriglobales bacterium]|nr:GWxTD domain-containing protein [Terriglobales bacterium]